MTKLKKSVVAFLRNEEGLTIVEYAVAGGLISVAVVAAFQALGLRVCQIIDTITQAIGGAATAC